MTDYKVLCAKVLAYHEGQDKYNFSHLDLYDRENAAFDAWQEITAELKHALDCPEPVDLSDMPEAEFIALCPQGYHGVDDAKPLPLWRVMSDAGTQGPCSQRDIIAAEIETLRDWLCQQLRQDDRSLGVYDLLTEQAQIAKGKQ